MVINRSDTSILPITHHFGAIFWDAPTKDDKNCIFNCSILKFTRPGWVAKLVAGGKNPNVNVNLAKLRISDIEFAFHKLYIQ